MKAAEVMTTDVVSVRPNATATEIAALLLEKQISALPVIDDEGRLVGGGQRERPASASSGR